MRSETRRALIPLGLQVGQWACFLAPVLGLSVFRMARASAALEVP